jgi:hypothetical protein
MGRPRLRWVEDVGKDLREMKVKRLRENVLDREEWAYVFKEARLPEGHTTKVIRLDNVHFFVCFVFSPTAHSGPGPPHSRGF